MNFWNVTTPPNMRVRRIHQHVVAAERVLSCQLYIGWLQSIFYGLGGGGGGGVQMPNSVRYVGDGTDDLKGRYDLVCPISAYLVELIGCDEIDLSVLRLMSDSRCCRNNSQSVFLMKRICLGVAF